MSHDIRKARTLSGADCVIVSVVGHLERRRRERPKEPTMAVAHRFLTALAESDGWKRAALRTPSAIVSYPHVFRA